MDDLSSHKPHDKKSCKHLLATDQLKKQVAMTTGVNKRNSTIVTQVLHNLRNAVFYNLDIENRQIQVFIKLVESKPTSSSFSGDFRGDFAIFRGFTLDDLEALS